MTLRSQICRIINTPLLFPQFLKEYSPLKLKIIGIFFFFKFWLVRHWLKKLIKNKQKKKKRKEKGDELLIILQIWERSVISPN